MTAEILKAWLRILIPTLAFPIAVYFFTPGTLIVDLIKFGLVVPLYLLANVAVGQFYGKRGGLPRTVSIMAQHHLANALIFSGFIQLFMELASGQHLDARDLVLRFFTQALFFGGFMFAAELITRRFSKPKS